MSVLGNKAIREEIQSGNIVVYPLLGENIKGTSIDVTLGEWYFDTRPKPFKHLFGTSDDYAFYNPFTSDGVKEMFGSPKRAASSYIGYEDDDEETAIPIPGIPKDHPVIWLRPRSRILAHTHEFIGVRNGTSEMRARSSWGRNGIGVCLCAGWGDPGFIGRWAMEIQNFNDHAVPLPVGERVAQIIFHDIEGLDSNYAEAEGSKYQSSSNLKELVENWTPESLLPRSYKDERKIPIPVYDYSVRTT